jgi:hypothetical protein
MKKREMINKTNGKMLKIIRNAAILSILALQITSCGRSAREEIMLRESMADTSATEPTLPTTLGINTSTPADKQFIKTADLKFKVHNTLWATQKIEELTSQFGGYTIYSNLQNRNDNYKKNKIGRDSVLISTQITVTGNIQLKVPGEKLDSFIRQLNPLVIFFDYRVIKLIDVTLDLLSDEQRTERMKAYEKRQTQHIDNRNSKLSEASAAEDHLLDKQLQSDALTIASKRTEDEVKFSTVSIDIYQQPLIVREIIPNFEYIANQKPSLWLRIADSLVDGWQILEEIIVFLVRIWGVLVIIAAIIFALRYLRRIAKRL